MLIGRSAPVTGRVFPLAFGRHLIGRGPDADIHLSEASVSLRHAELELRPDGAQLVNLISTNGTWINGAEIHTARLGNGDSIRIGRVTLQYQEPTLPAYGPTPCGFSGWSRPSFRRVDLLMWYGCAESAPHAAPRCLSQCSKLCFGASGVSGFRDGREDPFSARLDFEYGAVTELSPLIRRVIARNPEPVHVAWHRHLHPWPRRRRCGRSRPGRRRTHRCDSCSDNGERISHMLVTHTHMDHSPGCALLRERCDALRMRLVRTAPASKIRQ